MNMNDRMKWYMLGSVLGVANVSFADVDEKKVVCTVQVFACVHFVLLC